MPGILKRVHFANADVSFAAAGTPSPSHTDVSLPESDGPFTPPNLTLPVPLPGGGARLHAALAYRPSLRAALDWDVVSPPNTAALDQLSSPTRGGLRAALAAPATNPPLPYMELVLDCLPYRISVRPGTVVSYPSPYAAPGAPLPRADAYVTVGDVLNAIYLTLRYPVSRAELAVMGTVQTAALARAYEARIARYTDPRERHVEAEKGVKRIDWVIAAGATRFHGLRATRKGIETWMLSLG